MLDSGSSVSSETHVEFFEMIEILPKEDINISSSSKLWNRSLRRWKLREDWSGELKWLIFVDGTSILSSET
jgi:hypothetical protein